MAHQPNRTQWHALDMLAIALRPDWTNNKPGPTWTAKISNNTLPHAESFEHCVHALIYYATQSEPRKRTPDIYPEDGKHWDATRPAPVAERPGREPICQDHTAYNRRTCPICTDEIRDKQRSPQQRGKKIRQIVPSPGIRTRQPEPSPTRASMKESQT